MRLLWSVLVLLSIMVSAAPPRDARSQTLSMILAPCLDEAQGLGKSSDTDSNGSGDTAPDSDDVYGGCHACSVIPGSVQARIREDGRAGYAGRRRDIVRRDFEERKNAQFACKAEKGAAVPYELHQQVCNLTSVWQKQVLAAWLQLRLRSEGGKAKDLNVYLDQQEKDIAKNRLDAVLSRLQHQESVVCYAVYRQLYHAIGQDFRVVPGRGNRKISLLPPEKVVRARRRCF